MATYNVTSPDGRTFTVNAPAGTSEEELFKYVQSQLYTQPQAVGRTAQEAIEPYTEDWYESENPKWYKDVKDVGVGFASGVSKAAGALVGLGSYVPGVHYLADPVAKGLQDFGAFIDESLLSDRQKEINKELVTRLAEAAPNLPENATMDDYMDAMKAGGGEAWEFVKDHPTQVLNLIAASAPYILGGGVISKGLKGCAMAL